MSRVRRALIAVAAIGLTMSMAQFSAQTSYAAVSCQANGVDGDLNSDGLADVIVGVPSYDGDRGAIDILFSDGTRSFRTAGSLGLSSAPGDRFGESVSSADIDDDGCDDLAVGAPGHNSSRGRVHLLFGRADNSLVTGATFTGTAAHGSLGAQVVLLTTEKLTAAGYVRTGQQLVASAPTADDGSAWEAGRVVVQPLTATGALAAGTVIITQNSPGVPGTSENGDRFGTALAGQGRTIVIGTPAEAVGTRSAAGSVTLLSASAANPTTFAGVAVTQNTSGVPGTAESNDLFGSAVAFRDHYVLVGVPGETIGSAKGAGQAHVLNFDPATRKARSLRAVHQNTAGIPGANERGDYFGSSVALGINTLDQLTAIVGAPGEAIGTVLGAGAVTMFRANRSGGLAWTIRQGAGGIAGAPEAADHFGWSVSVLGGDLDDGEAMTDGVVVGTPHEDIGSTADAGSVTYTRSTDTWYTLLLEDTGSPSVPADAAFGETLAGMNG
ncbi:MAG: FG-GAP repeat protein [Micropruina sp.]|nr:FG-GAP repeat protein [Micropruina sp.]